MSAITIFSGTFCEQGPVIQKVLEKTGYKPFTDEDIVAEACRISGMAESKIRNAFSAKVSVFNKFTHEKEHAMAFLRLATAQLLSHDNLLIEGFAAHLIPIEISHVLRVCLIADMKARTSEAVKELKLSEDEAAALIHKQNEDFAVWTNTLFRVRDPWDASLYDIVIPTDKTDLDKIVELIEGNLRSEVIRHTETSEKEAQDFILAANVEVALAKEGHQVGVKSRDGLVTLTINKHVLMLARLEDELRAVASKVPGVRDVETRVGKGYHQTDIYRKYDFETPSKVLLVDDEREFVQTLSERLFMREMGAAVVYDGESALDMVRDDEPEVMILDLKMPGIDGIEVLQNVKKIHPKIEVIILTGHGSEADREVCMKLGAFAYLQKPVDINLLSETLKKANEKIRQETQTITDK